MGTYIHFTEEQKQRANSVDLIEFLRRQGETLLPSGREKRLKSNHSITVRGNEWFDHATSEGGLAIDFVQKNYGLSFPDAVTMLLGGEQGIAYSTTKSREKNVKPFALPSKNQDMRRVFAYLIKHRLIDQEVVSFFAKQKLIYESKELSMDQKKEYHNAIFVGYDEQGLARHAHKRGVYTEGKSFKGNIDSSYPGYSFHYIGGSDRIYVFEAPIDLLSFVTLYKDTDWKKHSYVALCGLSEQAIFKMLECHAHLSHVVLCLDHDPAGIEATEKISDMLNEKSICNSTLLSKYKDWNEDLKAMSNRDPIEAMEHPQFQMKNELCAEILKLANELASQGITYKDCEEVFEQAQMQDKNQAEAIKMASAFFICLATEVARGNGSTEMPENIIEDISQQFRAYQNRSRWNPTLSDVKDVLGDIKYEESKGTRTDSMKLVELFKKASLECIKAMIKLEMTLQKQEQKLSIKMA